MSNYINEFIRDCNHHWIADQRLYAPTNLGGLNCIKFDSFCMARRMNWLKRYINHRYDDYWTTILDEHLGVSPSNRKKIINYDSEYFTPLIRSCKFEIIRNMIKNLQAFLREFVTDPASGDNRYHFSVSLP